MSILVLPQMVEVTVTGKVKKHYQSKGYFVPHGNDTDGNLVVKRGTRISVYVLDLQDGSGVKVDILCDYCKRMFKRPYGAYLTSSINNKVPKDFCPQCRGVATTEKLLKYNFQDAVDI